MNLVEACVKSSEKLTITIKYTGRVITTNCYSRVAIALLLQVMGMLFSQASQGHMLNMNRLNVIVDSTDNMVFTVNIDQGSTLSQALFPLRDVVDGINNDREQAHGQKVQLIVANSHLHGDHYAAWNQFVDRPNTLSVVLTHNEVMDYWSFNSYPEQRINYKLGGRQFILTSATVFVSEVAAGATAARHRSARRCFTHRVVG